MNGFAGFLGRSLRGVRLVEFACLVMLLVMVLGVYLAKAAAGRERADITAVQQQIDDEQHRLRLLTAEVAHLEEPERLQYLAADAGLGPAKHQGSVDELKRISQDGLPPDKPHKASADAVSPDFAPPTDSAVIKTGAPR